MSFDRSIELFDGYYRVQDCANVAFGRDVAIEARKKLVQANRLLRMVRTINESISKFACPLGTISRGDDPAVDAYIENHLAEKDEAEMWTEAFYYFAFRARCILRDLPHLGDFECVGIRDVRNHLLEHPTGRGSGVIIPSFGFGGPSGPVVKALRYSGQEQIHSDAGLFPNAKEMYERLEMKLRPLQQ